MQSAAVLHDHLSRSTFSNLLQISALTDEKWKQTTLPITYMYGGFGLTSLQEISNLIFVSSWAHSVHELPKCFVALEPHIDVLLSSKSPENSSGHILHECLDPDQSMNDLLSTTKHLQHHLIDKVTKAQVNILLDKESGKDSARLRSLQGQGAGSWLNAIPSTQNLAILPGNFRLAAFMRLGMAMPLPLLADEYECECGKTIDREGYHLLTCKIGGGPVWSHICMVSVWADCLSQLHVPYYIEPKDRYTTSSGRPDIYVAESFCMPVAELDIALSHPFSKDILSRAAYIDGAAASRRQKIKHTKYDSQLLPGGFAPTVIPLVFEHYGRWGDEAQQFLKTLSLMSYDEDGHQNASNFTTYLRQRLSVQLQQCNAGVIFRKTSCLLEHTRKVKRINTIHNY